MLNNFPLSKEELVILCILYHVYSKRIVSCIHLIYISLCKDCFCSPLQYWFPDNSPPPLQKCPLWTITLGKLPPDVPTQAILYLYYFAVDIPTCDSFKFSGGQSCLRKLRCYCYGWELGFELSGQEFGGGGSELLCHASYDPNVNTKEGKALCQYEAQCWEVWCPIVLL